MSGLAVEMRGVVKQFGGTRALAGVALTLPAGSVHGLIGPNGSGKSTLVKILTGFYDSDEGSIFIDGEEASLGSPLAARQRGIELVPQELSLVPDMTVWENVVLGSEPKSAGRLDVAASRRVARGVLERLRLEVDLDTPAADVNPAEQRLLMIARTLHRGARLLIVDEPTAGLPPAQALRVIDALRDVARQDVTILFVSHHLAEVEVLCDAVTVLTDGHVTGHLAGDDLDQDGLIAAIMGEASDEPADTPSVARDLGERVLTVTQLAGDSLEQLDFEANRGEIIGIAGLLGSGREECIDLIAGAVRRTDGEVVVNGQPLKSPKFAADHKVGYVSGNRTLAVIPGWDVGDHVTLPGLGRWRRRITVDRRSERKAADGAIVKLSVKGASGDSFETLSGGNQQRVLFARWIATEVDLLLVDEPCVGVDVASRRELLDVLRSMAATRCIVVSSSDPADLVEVCDRVICLYRGRTVGQLLGDDITERNILSSITRIDPAVAEVG
jgi:ABC-type sugar transport system ATPase subunit